MSYSAYCIILCVNYCLVLARYKMSKEETQRVKTARDLGKASYVTSVVGIVVAVIIIFVVLVAVSRQSLLVRVNDLCAYG